jgi:spore germination cell wall hydrolase CwlJ-like protein
MNHNLEILKYMSDAEVLARTIYGEARGEYHPGPNGTRGLIAVGNVVMNRVAQQTWFGRSVGEVCLKPYQFSCWNPNDPNRLKLLTVSDESSIFRTCFDVALTVTAMMCADETCGSDHYFSTSMKTLPPWVGDAPERIRIGRHRFYKIYPSDFKR